MASDNLWKALIGGTTTTAGAIIGGPAGAAVGAGAGQLINTLGFGKEKDVPALPPLVDPNQAALQEELQRRKRAIEMGTSVEFQTAREIIQRSEATLLDRVAGVTGGDVSGAVAAMERISQSTGANIGKIVSQSSQMASPYIEAISDLTNRIAQRKLELQLAARSQAMTENAQLQSDRAQSLSNILTSETFINGVGAGGEWLGSLNWGNLWPFGGNSSQNMGTVVSHSNP